MSTRGFFTIVIDGDEKTVFNHFDSYPAGLGVSVLKWLTGQALNDVDTLYQQARALVMVPQADATRHMLYDLERDPANLLRTGTAVSDAEFPLDSLFAEWGYVVDLDQRVFEVYRGFQTHPHDRGRFASRRPAHYERRLVSGNVYYPVTLIASWPLSALPTFEQLDQMVSQVHDEEETAYIVEIMQK